MAKNGRPGHNTLFFTWICWLMPGSIWEPQDNLLVWNGLKAPKEVGWMQANKIPWDVGLCKGSPACVCKSVCSLDVLHMQITPLPVSGSKRVLLLLHAVQETNSRLGREPQGRKSNININRWARMSCGHCWPLRPDSQGSKSFSSSLGPQEDTLLVRTSTIFGADRSVSGTLDVAHLSRS